MTANTLIFDIADKFRDRGLPIIVTRSILDMAQQLQRQFIESDETALEACRAHVFALQELVDTRLAEGDTKAALNAAERSRNMINGLAVNRPGNAGWQRDLSVSYDKVGEVLQAQGKLPEALNSYRNSLAIADRLAIVAMVESQLGARDDALRALHLGQVIIAYLVRQSPDNGTLPKDLAWFDTAIASLSGRRIIQDYAPN